MKKRGTTMNINKIGLLLSFWSLSLLSSVPVIDGKPITETGFGDVIPDQYVVEFKPGTQRVEALAKGLAQGNKGQAGHIYKYAIQGFVYRGKNPEALEKNPNVLSVTPDFAVTANQQQTTPTGIKRIFADKKNYLNIASADCRCDAVVAVLDTGVFNHPDLKINFAMSRDFSGSTTGFTDVNGHGTHVAGTIGAINNGEGVVGVCPGAEIWAIKVLGDNGGGSFSNVIAGIDYVADQGSLVDVINMSLGGQLSGGGCWSTICNSISGAENAGVAVAIAAGNSNNDTQYFVPACCAQGLTVSAIEDRDGLPATNGVFDPRASFSNWGPAVDITAPGVSINSTWKNGGYASISGTSMATPHVAGALAVLASVMNPKASSGTIVRTMYNELKAKGNMDWDDSRDPDDVKEPLLDMTDLVEAAMVGQCPADSASAPESAPTTPAPAPTNAPTTPAPAPTNAPTTSAPAPTNAPTMLTPAPTPVPPTPTPTPTPTPAPTPQCAVAGDSCKSLLCCASLTRVGVNRGARRCQ